MAKRWLISLPSPFSGNMNRNFAGMHNAKGAAWFHIEIKFEIGFHNSF